ncbi:CYIR protein [Plasmodium cynomolgi strain B]|uniref:CYIR protein n=1 Tax=Plasmodium cynomolgi (strain B) TaxID=1120755 RepID=K6V0D8_PLACD|nr:CYIR protein [Plasmodium cynomolgi strain B]GAB69774.1 CYIR protein [Plasmodium cynomolgi strain B]
MKNSINEICEDYFCFQFDSCSDIHKLYDEKCFDLIICNEYKEDVIYESYIKRDVLITRYKDFDAYKVSCEPKKKNKQCKFTRKYSNSY